jgi:sugar/nucleoside kinase (ribokinase family)
MSGGTAFYFSHAIRCLDTIDYLLCTAVGKSDMQVADEMKNRGININIIPCESSVFFENIYDDNPDNRVQRVLAKAVPFTVDEVRSIDSKIVHLGALLADDFPPDTVEFLAGKSLVSVDSQGFLREVGARGNVIPIDWRGKEEMLQYIYFLKANEHELKTLTGISDIFSAVKKIYDWGVKEVIGTLGSSGSVIFDGKTYYKIPSYEPPEIIDTTGCGDTYMAGYLYQRLLGKDIEEAGRFGAAMATLKIQHLGPFDKTKEDIYNCMNSYKRSFYDV